MQRLWRRFTDRTTGAVQMITVSLLLCSGAVRTSAQVEVVKGKHSFGVSGFTGDAAIAGQVTDVLKNDLRLSGYFSLAPVSSAEYVQSGSVRGDHNGIVVECVVMQQATKNVALSKAYQGSAQDLRRVVHKLSDDIVQTLSGQRGIAQTKIAFVWQHNGAKELAVTDYDGYNVHQLTYDRSISVRPRWSPDGRKIVYTSYKNVFPDVLEVDLYTGQRRRLAAYPGLNTGAAFSPDGLSIALTLSKDGNPELYTMDASGGDLRRLTHTRAGESSPTWSPDGQAIAYVSDESGVPQIWQIGKDGGTGVEINGVTELQHGAGLVAPAGQLGHETYVGGDVAGGREVPDWRV